MDEGARRFASLRQSLAPTLERYASLGHLARSFHAAFVAIEPGRDPPAGIVLRYEFKSAGELDDFRSRPGAWAVRHGALVGVAEPQGELLETVAWFQPPVTVKGDLVDGCSLVVGLGNLRVAPGHGEDSRLWHEEGEATVPVLAAPTAPAGPWIVTFREGAVEIGVAGKTLRIDVPAPPEGREAPRGARVSLKLAPGRAISRLTIEASLEPTWAAERARIASGIR